MGNNKDLKTIAVFPYQKYTLFLREILVKEQLTYKSL